MTERGPLTREELQSRLDLVKKCDGNKSEAARRLGIHRTTLRDNLVRAARLGMTGYAPVQEGFEITKISTGPLGEFVTQKPEHGEIYVPPKHYIAGKITVNRDAEGRVIQDWPRYLPDTSNITHALANVFEQYKGKAELIEPPKYVERDLEWVIPIADQHHGLLAWSRDTGENHDLKTGVKRLRSTATKLISRCDPAGTGIILNVGDWTHNDDQTNMTPASRHVLDVDSRYYKILETGAWLMVDIVGLALQKFKRVIVVNLPGNHDPHATTALNVALSMFYHKNPRVSLVPPEGKWFFHKFGQTLLGAHHGDRISKDEMAMAMAVRCREDWGATNFHWVLSGHIHKETGKEVGDVRVESFQTLAGKDAFSAGHGYVSGRSMVAIQLHREEGERDRLRENIPPPPRPATIELSAA